MPRRSVPVIPPDLRARLEAARLDTLALVRALDHARLASTHVPHPHIYDLLALDADCAEALWALDQPAGSLDLRAMLRDTLASLNALPEARQQVRARLPATATPSVLTLETTIRAGLDPSEAYNDVPSGDPHSR